MNLFRLFLITCIVVVSTYTGVTIAEHGFMFLTIFLEDLVSMSWAGQFNMDFLTFLMLASIWVSWRHTHSPTGLFLGSLVFIGGMPYLASYLLFHSFQSNGDIKKLLLGNR